MQRAFTLTELVVALAVVALLIGILMPSLAGVREHARRIVCGSNQRQVGLGIHLYADQWDSRLPTSIFLGDDPGMPGRSNDNYRPQDMVTVRVTDEVAGDVKDRDTDDNGDSWDGLGILFAGGYVPAPKVFYCPSHSGEYKFHDFSNLWSGTPGEIVSNYHYRGMGPNNETRLHLIAQDAAIVSDSLRSLDELNHEGGFNVLHAGLSVSWMPDEKGTIAAILARQGDGGGGDSTLADEIWGALDGDGGVGGGGSSSSGDSDGG